MDPNAGFGTVAPKKPSLTNLCSFWTRSLFYGVALLGASLVAGSVGKAMLDLKSTQCATKLCLLSFDFGKTDSEFCDAAKEMTPCNFVLFAGGVTLILTVWFLFVTVYNMCKKKFAHSRMVIFEVFVAGLLSIVWLSSGALVTARLSQYCSKMDDFGEACDYLDKIVEQLAGRKSADSYNQLQLAEAGSWMSLVSWLVLFMVTFCRWRVANKKARNPEFDNPVSSEA
eukprot:m.178324 g.178324  ORF g.178324 m.178324 type:complete len:227 (-) comp17979_c3_seq1:69-749(-)